MTPTTTLARLCRETYGSTTTIYPYTAKAVFTDRNAHAVVYESPTDVVVCFRGSDDWMDYVYSSLCWSTAHQGGGRVHYGYARQLAGLMTSDFRRLMDSIRKPFYITGHSLGGALALLLSLEHYRRGHFVACVTFASPKCLDGGAVLNALELVHHRYTTSGGDYVPKLFLGYRHTSAARQCPTARGHAISSFLQVSVLDDRSSVGEI